jgi:hypothetical protein
VRPRGTGVGATVGARGGLQQTAAAGGDWIPALDGDGEPRDGAQICEPAGLVIDDYPRLGCSTEAVQPSARVNVTCVTPLGEEVASTW